MNKPKFLTFYSEKDVLDLQQWMHKALVEYLGESGTSGSISGRYDLYNGVKKAIDNEVSRSKIPSSLEENF